MKTSERDDWIAANEVMDYFSWLGVGRYRTRATHAVNAGIGLHELVTLLNLVSLKDTNAKNECKKIAYSDWFKRWQNKKGDNIRPKRNLFPERKPIDYANVDFYRVISCADKLIAVYFDNGEWGEIVRNRYALSVATALNILRNPDTHKYGCAKLASGFNWAYDSVTRASLHERLMSERQAFLARGMWRDNLDELKKILAEQPSYSISDCLSGNGRALVMLAVLAKLMVICATNHSFVWERDTLFNVYEHVLCATQRKYELPFSFHLDISTGAYLRVGRTHDRQTNLVDDFIESKFYDASEQLLFSGFVTYYLMQRNDRHDIFQGICENSRMIHFFSEKQLKAIGIAISKNRAFAETRSVLHVR